MYKILGFGFPLGQPSKMARRELEDIPSASVSTSVGVIIIIIIINLGGRMQGPHPWILTYLLTMQTLEHGYNATVKKTFHPRHLASVCW